MESKTLKTLEFDKILNMLSSFAKNDAAKDKAVALKPSADARAVLQMLQETDAASVLILKYGSPDIVRINDVNESVKRLAVGGGLSMSELLNIGAVLRGARIMKKYTPEQAGILSGYIEELVPDKRLEERISTSIISDEEMADGASAELAVIRRKIKNTSAKIKDSLDSMIHSSTTANFCRTRL